MPQKSQPARLRTLGDIMSESMGDNISESLGGFVGIGSSSVIARCEAAEVLEPVEASLNAVSLLIGFGIVRDGDFARSV